MLNIKVEQIPFELFGKDHWSTLGYIETRIVDCEGVPALPHMRANPDLHPDKVHIGSSQEYPTRLRYGLMAHGHDDWSCLDDFERLGLLENIGTGMNRVYRFTKSGQKLASELRAHKANQGSFSNFIPKGKYGQQTCENVG